MSGRVTRGANLVAVLAFVTWASTARALPETPCPTDGVTFDTTLQANDEHLFACRPLGRRPRDPVECCRIVYGVRVCASSTGDVRVGREVPTPAIRSAVEVVPGGPLVVSALGSIFVARTFTGTLERVVLDDDPFVPFTDGDAALELARDDEGTARYSSASDPPPAEPPLVAATCGSVPRRVDPATWRYLLHVGRTVIARTRSGRLALVDARGAIAFTPHGERVVAVDARGGRVHWLTASGCVRATGSRVSRCSTTGRARFARRAAAPPTPRTRPVRETSSDPRATDALRTAFDYVDGIVGARRRRPGETCPPPDALVPLTAAARMSRERPTLVSSPPRDDARSPPREVSTHDHDGGGD